jgi:hypothetical protein
MPKRKNSPPLPDYVGPGIVYYSMEGTELLVFEVGGETVIHFLERLEFRPVFVDSEGKYFLFRKEKVYVRDLGEQ